MAKKHQATRKAPAQSKEPVAMTLERFRRLYRLVQLLAKGPRKREVLIERLGLEVRGFYRDLNRLREAGIRITLKAGRYGLEENTETALQRLPFPDPYLTLGEAMQLSKGRTTAHRKIKQLIKESLPG
jgi:predicted DNA-binding transcriptional regulator YafY